MLKLAWRGYIFIDSIAVKNDYIRILTAVKGINLMFVNLISLFSCRI